MAINWGQRYPEQRIQNCSQFLNRNSGSRSYVKDLAAEIGSIGRQQIGPNHVLHVDKIAALLAVAINYRRLAPQHPGDKDWNNRGILGTRVLPGPEDVEVTQADGIEVIELAENLAVLLGGQFLGAVGRQGFPFQAFLLGKSLVIAVDGRRRGKNKAADSFFGGRQQQVQGSGQVDFVGQERFGNRPGYRGQGGLVQDYFHPFGRLPAEFSIPDIAADYFNLAGQVGKIFFPAGGKIIQNPDPAAQVNQFFHQVGTDKTRSTGHQVTAVFKHYPDS